MAYILNLLIAIDQLFNALLLGSADETLSSRAHRAWRDGRWFGVVFRPLINLIFFWQKDHCLDAYLSEVHRQQYPKTFR
jgi:hypothetical protein